jgi:hypothetical protein
VNVREPATPAAFTPPVSALAVAPELAALALLEAALDVASAALVAAHPELMRPDDFEPSTDSAQIATAIVEQARALCGNVNRYRVALVVDPGPDGPIPF